MKLFRIEINNINIQFKKPIDQNFELDNYEKEVESNTALEELKSILPDELNYIGEIDDEIFNGWNQIIKEEYYIIKLTGQEYDWALCRIYWDDNWESWEFSADVGLIGNKTQKEASICMLKYLWELWEIDISDKSDSPHFNLLSQIMRS